MVSRDTRPIAGLSVRYWPKADTKMLISFVMFLLTPIAEKKLN